MAKIFAKILAGIFLVIGAYLYGYHNGESSEFDEMLFTLGANAATFRVMLNEKGADETIKWHEPTDQGYIEAALLAYGRNLELENSSIRYIYPGFKPLNAHYYKNVVKYFELYPYDPKFQNEINQYYESEISNSESKLKKYGLEIQRDDYKEMARLKLLAVKKLKIREASNKSLKDAP